MKTRVLVFCDDPWHPADLVRRGLAGLGGAFSFEFVEGDNQVRMPEPDNGYALIVLARSNVARSKVGEPWLTSSSALALREHVRRGTGLLAVHGGTARYEKLPAMNGLLGGAFVRHPDACTVTLEPVKSNLMTHGVEVFTVHDEHYFISPLSADAEVFLQSRSAHGLQPAGWTRPEGAGRVCVLTPGHDLEVWLHPEFQKLLLNALCWTAKLN